MFSRYSRDEHLEVRLDSFALLCLLPVDFNTAVSCASYICISELILYLLYREDLSNIQP